MGESAGVRKTCDVVLVDAVLLVGDTDSGSDRFRDGVVERV